MNLEYFNFIIQVAEQGSISKAAQHLFLSQPYLSKVIKEVETELNIEIFIRTNRGISLTPEGKKFIKKAEIILSQYKSLQDIDVKDSDDVNKFTVTTVRSSLVMESFIHLMRQYEHHDHITFTIKESDSHTPVHDVTYLDSDIGIIYTWDPVKPKLLADLKRKNIIYEKVCDLNICIVLGVNHPLVHQTSAITFSDLYNYGFVTYEKNHLPYATERSSNDFLECVVDYSKIKNKIYVSNRASLHNILTHTDYFSIGTQSARDQENMFNIISIPLPESYGPFMLEMGVLYRDNTPLNPIAKEFMDMLQHNYGEDS